MEFNLNGEIYKETVFKDYFVTKCGKIAKIKFDKNNNLKSYYLHKQEKTKNGRLRVEIYKKHYLVHRIVYQTWSNNTLDNELVIDHIDANPLNNHIDNLKQCTQKENIQNAIEHGNFGHNHNTKIKVLNKETEEINYYNSIKDFLISINAPNYMISHGGLSSLKKRRRYDKYYVEKINEH